MIKAIFYKEWIKLRWFFLLALIAGNGITAYCMMRLNRAIELKGASHIWEVIIMKNAVFIDYLQFVPLVIGL